MDTTMFSIRLQEARKMMGWSMEQLSEETSRTVTKQSISKYEKGIMFPRINTLSVLAKALNISIGYFSGQGMHIDTPMLRNAFKDSLPQEDNERLVAMLSFWSEQYVETEKRAGMEAPFVNPIVDIVVETLDEACAVADHLRRAWNLGTGPIPSVLRLMERKGIKILDRQLPMGVLGLSTWANDIYPLVAIDMNHEKHTPERLRFTASHELGHIMMNIPSDTAADVRERLCSQFAGCFLLPKSTLYEEIGGTTRESVSLDELIDLHEAYGVSVSALVHELWDFRIISREHYDWWFDERIKKNRKEVGWGEYLFPETLGREKRVKSIIVTNNNKT